MYEIKFGEIMTIQYTKFAYLKDTKEIKYIDDVENGNKCNCICLCCGEELIAKHGKINTHHFSHRVNSNCIGGSESLLHLLTKDIIEENKEIFLPYIEIDSTILSKYFNKKHLDITKEFFNANFEIKNIILEERVEHITPDIKAAVIYNDFEFPIFIEIAVTHFTEDKKKDFLLEKKHNCIEINMSKIYNKLENNTNLEGIKKEINIFLNDKKNNHNFKWISQFIINEKEETNKFNLLFENKIKLKNKTILDQINIGFKFKHEIEDITINKEKNNFFGKYIRYLKRNPLSNEFFEIVEIKERNYETNVIEATIKCGEQEKNVSLLINNYKINKVEQNNIVINFDIYNNDTKKRTINNFLINDVNKILKLNTNVVLDDYLFFNKEEFEKYMQSEINNKKEVKRYKKFLYSLYGKNVVLPNPCFNDGLAIFDYGVISDIILNVPENMTKNQVKLKINNVQTENIESPNILKVFYNKTKFFYVVFHSSIEYAKSLSIYKNRYKHKKSILFFEFNGKAGFPEFKDGKWNKKEIKYEWIYHTGFEKVKVDLINKSHFDFKKGCRMFYKKYGNILGNINN
jgi:hypothetical protein